MLGKGYISVSDSGENRFLQEDVITHSLNTVPGGSYFQVFGVQVILISTNVDTPTTL